MQNTEKEVLVFRKKRSGWGKVFWIGLVGLGLLTALEWLMHRADAPVFGILFLVGCPVIVYVRLDQKRTRLEIHPDRLRSIKPFRTREIPWERIQGFRILPLRHTRALELILRGKWPQKMRIALDIEGPETFLATLEKRLPNLDREAREADLRELFQQPCFGDATPEEKAQTVRRLRKVCRAINYAAIAVALWAFFYPHPYEGLIWTLVAFPLPALFLLRRYEGVIRFYPRQGSVFPRVEAAFILPAMALALRAAMDWHTLDWHPFLPPFVTLFLLGSLLGLATARELRRSALCTALFGLAFLFYAFGAVDTLNGMLATSPATAYRVQVQSKRTQHEKITLYYLTVTPWGHRTEPTNEVIVSEEVYQRANPGGTVEIQVRTGKFGIPFYQVR